MRTMTGTCHCGAVAFTIPADTDFSRAARCDCSLCRRRWVPTATVPLEMLNVVKGRDVLDCYEWNTKPPNIIIARPVIRICFINAEVTQMNMGESGCFDEVDMFGLAHAPIHDGVNHPSDQ